MEVPIVVSLWFAVAAWVLAPYWAALKLQPRVPSRIATVILGLAVVLVGALGASSFLVTSAFVGGPAHPTADALTLILVPVLQWFVLGVAAIVGNLTALRRRG